MYHTDCLFVVFSGVAKTTKQFTDTELNDSCKSNGKETQTSVSAVHDTHF